MKLDVLAIGVHPDDVELGCAGALIIEIKNGKKVGIVDLTRGELGTRGSAETRDAEAKKAADIIGVAVRENLSMRDGFFRNDEEHQLRLVQTIRKYKPEIVFANVLEDRHPDHGRAGHLIEAACFLSGLVKVVTTEDGQPQEKWRPKYVLHYIQDWYHEPDLLIDVSPVFEQKMRSIEAYTTQFYVPQERRREGGGEGQRERRGEGAAANEAKEVAGDEGLQTYISTPDFLESVVARARMLGKKIGVKYAEGFLSDKKIGIRNLDALLQVET